MASNINDQLVQVPKEQFYAMIGPLERIDSGATMHHHPEKILRWRMRQWVGGGYEEVAASEEMLDQPWPHPINYYVSQRIIEEFITF